ncbi:hypothetical protein GCM10022252_19940 [Streptosporangium oxazolinicum]|uniref:Uncharacterized protein n=1 Tax=Streptosporangium oxazolinicum TaxID=909287 RepID=A0ABP8APB3_9ACTN
MRNPIARAQQVQQTYRKAKVSDGDNAEIASDIIADQLRTLPGDEWERVIRNAVRNAHEEIHGDSTALNIELWIDGLAYTVAECNEEELAI